MMVNMNDTHGLEVMNDEALQARLEALSEAYESSDAYLNVEADPLNTRYGLIEVIYVYRNDDDDEVLEAAYIKRGDKVMRLEGFDAGDLFNGLRALRFSDTLIQNALPTLTPAQREFIMTGLTA
jgi:hypothetical protein